MDRSDRRSGVELLIARRRQADAATSRRDAAVADAALQVLVRNEEAAVEHFTHTIAAGELKALLAMPYEPTRWTAVMAEVRREKNRVHRRLSASSRPPARRCGTRQRERRSIRRRCRSTRAGPSEDPGEPEPACAGRRRRTWRRWAS